MKYIEIDIDRAVELYRQGKEKRVFRKCDSGELERVTSLSETFGMFVMRSRYFEQIAEDRVVDIERLKELKADFEMACKYNDMYCMSTAEEDDVLELIDEAIASQSVTNEEVQRAIEELSQASDAMHYAQDGAHVPISLATIDLAITALEKIGTNTVDVAWTEAYQSYESAGGEAVPYCPKCDADLEDDQKFCKDCGVELIWPYEWDGYITVQEPEH